MSKQYYAIQKKDSNELTHWKYIKRVRKNGKWRYYYDKDALKKNIQDIIGLDAKRKMESSEKYLLEANKELKSLNKLLADKIISRSEYDTKIQELTKKYNTSVTESGFDKGVQKSYEQYIIDNFETMSKRDYDKALKTYNELNSKSNNTQAKTDNYKMAIDSYARLSTNKTNDIRETETSIRSIKNRISQLENSRMSNKSIYDKSLVGYIDRGKSKVEYLLRSKLRIH